MKDYNIDTLPIPGDFINHSELGNVKVLKIIDVDIYGGPAEYEIENSNGKIFPITFDELTDMIGYGDISDVPQTLKNSFDFQLIDQEISESRLFRYTSQFGNLTGRTIADLLYLNTLMLLMFVYDKEQRDYAVAVARKTVQFGPFAVFRTTSTDLYMLAFAVDHPDYKSLNIKKKDEAFLNSLNFQNRRYYNFLKKMATIEPGKSEASAFFIRLENQLQIKTALYKQLRRLIIDWKDLKYSQKQLVVSKLLQQLRIKGRGSENYQHLVAMKRERKFSNAPKSDRSLAKTAVGTAAGAYVGSKVIPKLTRNKLSSRTGAGIGAIAGYWASGRRKQV